MNLLQRGRSSSTSTRAFWAEQFPALGPETSRKSRPAKRVASFTDSSRVPVTSWLTAAAGCASSNPRWPTPSARPGCVSRRE